MKLKVMGLNSGYPLKSSLLYYVGLILYSRIGNLMTALNSIPAHLKANRLILHYGQPQLTWIGLLIRPRISWQPPFANRGLNLDYLLKSSLLYYVGLILYSRIGNLMTALNSIPAHLKANRLILHYGQPQLTWIGLLIRPRISWQPPFANRGLTC